jgi:hypothetical protein
VTEQPAALEHPFPLERIDQMCRIAQRLGQRPVQLRRLGGHHRAAHLRDQFLTQLLFFGLERGLQLPEAPLA